MPIYYLRWMEHAHIFFLPHNSLFFSEAADLMNPLPSLPHLRVFFHLSMLCLTTADDWCQSLEWTAADLIVNPNLPCIHMDIFAHLAIFNGILCNITVFLIIFFYLIQKKDQTQNSPKKEKKKKKHKTIKH